MEDKTRRKELGEFLKKHRDNLQPEDVGRERGPRRRVAGLRRGEVAELCGIGEQWYTLLEQGRADSVSLDVLSRLAEVFCLDVKETRYLFSLSYRLPPRSRSPQPSESQPKHNRSLHRLLDALNPHPAYAINQTWDIIAFNRASAVLIDGLSDIPEEKRNIIYMLFFHPPIQELLIDWQKHAKRALASFRNDYSQNIEAEAMSKLIQRMQTESKLFSQFWALQEVNTRLEVQKLFRVSGQPPLTFDVTALTYAENPEIQIAVYLPSPDTNTAERFGERYRLAATAHERQYIPQSGLGGQEIGKAREKITFDDVMCINDDEISMG